MSTNEFNKEYYLVYGTNNPNCPAVELDEDKNGADFRRIKTPIENCGLVKMRIIEPYPKTPEMTDFHQNGIVSFFSKKIYDKINSIVVSGVQFLLGEIRNPKNNNIYENYYYLHIYSYINCLDRELSELDSNARTGMVRSISKIVLDTEVLSKIPLQERLIFRLGEMSAFQLFHKSVVDAIMATEPTGIRFVKVEDYHTGSAFD